MVAARIVAMHVGASLYGWTGAIGCVLAGLALGSAASVWVADRGGGFGDAALWRALAWAALLPAVWAVAVTFVTSALPVTTALHEWPPLARLVALGIALGLVPAAFLGAAGPLIARLAIRSVAGAGAAVGGVGAATTLGSLAGTAGAGALLIPSVGVRGTALVAALALFAAALLATPRAQRRRELPMAVPALLLLACVLAIGQLPSACDRESAYQCIRVADDETAAGQAYRTLYLDGLPHSGVVPDDPLFVVSDYLFPAVELAAYLRPVGGPPPTVLLIGGGGYTLARYLVAAYPGATVDVLELDAEVTAIAHERLGLARDAPMTIRHGDARRTIEELPPERRYDLVVLDAFSDVVVPYHLTTRELDARVRAVLAPGGAYLALVHDFGDRGRLLPAFARTVRSVFGAVTVAGPGPGVRWETPRSRTWSVVGTPAPLDAARFAAARHLTSDGLFPPLSELMPAETLERLLARPGPALLTDDYAPVEILAAPLFW